MMYFHLCLKVSYITSMLVKFPKTQNILYNKAGHTFPGSSINLGWL